MRYGGPILYLIIYAFVLLGILLWVDSGSRKFRLPKKGDSSTDLMKSGSGSAFDADFISTLDDPLRVLDLSKSFNKKQIVDHVNLNIPKDTIFALLGPNGAGKTTIFNIIRELSSPYTSSICLILLQEGI